jgi:CubicO group peptidase (beta-lactamase class C family)
MDNPEVRSMVAAASGRTSMTVSDLAQYVTSPSEYRFGRSALDPRWMAQLWRVGQRVDEGSGAVGGYSAWYRVDQGRRLVICYVANANLTNEQASELEGYLRSL